MCFVFYFLFSPICPYSSAVCRLFAVKEVNEKDELPQSGVSVPELLNHVLLEYTNTGALKGYHVTLDDYCKWYCCSFSFTLASYCGGVTFLGYIMTASKSRITKKVLQYSLFNIFWGFN